MPTTNPSEGNPPKRPRSTRRPARPATVEKVRLEDARKNFGNLLTEIEGTGKHVVLTRYGDVKGVIISIDDYRSFRELTGDPTDL